MAAEDFQPIVIRYDGLDADSNQIELESLGQSLQGAAKLIGVASNYIITRRYVKKMPALSVRVMAREAHGKCFEVVTVVAPIAAAAPLPLVKELGSKAVEYVITYILAKFSGRPDQMERVLNLLETSMKESGETSRTAINAMRDSVVALAGAQRPAARLFVSPVGETVSTARLGAIENEALTIDKPMKDAILAPDEVEVTDEREFQVQISELDIHTGGCKVSIEGDDEPDRRYASEITDPVVRLVRNPYAEALAEQRWLGVKAKAQLKDGDIDKLYISNTAGP
jgi:hypothetical protein